ncbi:MAG: VOC family protein [Parvularculaceae bacterium]
MPAAARPDHLVLMASSLERSDPYYAALLPLLGFVILKPGRWRSPWGFIIQLHQAKPGTRGYERHGAGMNHLGFSVPSPDDAAAVKAGMAERGFDVPEIQNLGGVTALFMKDPDGIRIEISHFPPDIDANA